MRKLLLAAASLLVMSAAAHAQCVGSVGVTTIDNCAAAVSVQPTDKVFGWQNGQNPHTRKITVGQILGALNSGTQVTSPSTSTNLVLAPNGTTPQLISISSLLAMIGPPTANQVSAALGYVPLSPANNLSELADPVQARANLGIQANGTTSTGLMPTWTTPSTVSANIGYNTSTNRFDFIEGGATRNYVRTSGDTISGALTLSGGGTFSGTIAGAHTYSGAITLSAAATALTVNNNATVTGTLTTGAVNLSGTGKFGVLNAFFQPNTGQDGASVATANMAFGSWNGIGITPTTGAVQKIANGLYGIFWNARTGDSTNLGTNKVGGNLFANSAKLSTSGTTTTLDTGGWTAALTSSTPAAGGSGAAVNDRFYDAQGNIYTATAVTGGAVTTLTLDTANPLFGATPANPVALTAVSPSTATGVTATLTWTQSTTLTLNPSGGTIVSGSLQAPSYKVGATAGVTCSGTPTASFASTNGIITHC